MINYMLRALTFVALFLCATIAAAHGEQSGNFIVKTVVPDSAAALAGIKVGDHILQIGDQTLQTQTDLQQVLATHRPGDTVPLVVERDSQRFDLQLTFQEGSSGGPSIGVSVAIGAAAREPEPALSGPTLTREACVAWIGDRYSVEARARELGPQFESDAKKLTSCLASNIQGMPNPMPVGWCDNAFKIHCSGLDLLTEIGEVQVEGCEALLGEKLSSCASQKVFDRYSVEGLVSDLSACRTARDSCSASHP